MDNIGNDLFLISANLTQLKNKDSVIKLFIEGLNSVFPGINFAWFDRDSDPVLPFIEVCTRNKKYSSLHFNMTLQENEEYFVLVQNFAQVIAVLLEKIEQEELLIENERKMKILLEEKTLNLSKTEGVLNETEEIFNHFMINSPIYVFFKDSEIRSLKLSRNYEKMLGRPLPELIGKTMDDLFPSDLAKKMISDDKRILQSGKLEIIDEELNGRYYTTLKFPIIVGNEHKYLAGYTIDFTDQKLAEIALKEKAEELERFNNLLIGRELKMIELKKEINDLLENNGEKGKYKIQY